MKPWYLSKTIWANIVAAIALVLNSRTEMLGAEEIAGITVVVNLILRAVTKSSIHVKAPPYLLLLTLCGALLSSGCATPPPGYEADTTPGHNGEAWRGGADDMPAGPSGMRVEARDDTLYIGVDILGLKNYRVRPWARESWGILKVVTYPADYVGYMAENHPWQTLALGLAAWEVTDNGVSSLFGGGSSGGSGRSEAPQYNRGTNISVSGSRNSISISPTTVNNPPPLAPLAPSDP